jgi:protein-disulfide isomerase
VNSKLKQGGWAALFILTVGLAFLLVQSVTGEVTESAQSLKTAMEGPPALPFGRLLVKGPDSAAVTIIEYNSFGCPPCRRAESVLDQVMKAYPGEIRVVFKHFPLAVHPNAILLHEAAMAAAEQGKFWPMVERLNSRPSALKRDALVQYAVEVGLNVEQFSLALDDHRYRDTVYDEMAEAKGYGVEQTPTFFINGRKLVGSRSPADFSRIIDQELGITERAEAPGQPPGPPPADISTVNLAKAPVRGASDAPVTFVEFSDFQCPYCGQAAPMMTQLMAAYPGKIKWIFKHFPLPIHPDAPLAHQAALAAEAQGKFWEMHDKIFANQRSLKKETYIGYAKELGLDVARFEKDLDSGKYKPALMADLADGQKVGIRGTPTFFINGKRVVGALPIDAFKQIMDQELKTVGK